MIKRNYESFLCKKVVNDTKNYLNFIKSTIKKEKRYVEKITKLSELLLQKEINDTLKKISVEELNKNKEGIRVKTLKDAKYNSIYDLQKASVYELEEINGISLDMARLIKKRVSSIIKETSKFIKLQISVDNKTKEIESLVFEVVILAHLYTYINIYNEFLNENSEYIKLKLKEIIPLTNAVQWFFTFNYSVLPGFIFTWYNVIKFICLTVSVRID